MPFGVDVVEELRGRAAPADDEDPPGRGGGAADEDVPRAERDERCEPDDGERPAPELEPCTQ